MRDIILNEVELDQIARRVAGEITEVIKNDKKIPVLVGVLKGSLNFMLALMKYIDVPFYTDYIQITSYVGSTRTTTTRLLKDLSYNCEGRSVIIIEDIVDTGYSIKFLLSHIASHHPKKVYVCTLLDKKNCREVEVPIDFVGHVLEGNDFVIGYGLDYNELCRNLNYIFNASPEDIAELDKILEDDDKYM